MGDELVLQPAHRHDGVQVVEQFLHRRQEMPRPEGEGVAAAPVGLDAAADARRTLGQGHVPASAGQLDLVRRRTAGEAAPDDQGLLLLTPRTVLRASPAPAATTTRTPSPPFPQTQTPPGRRAPPP